MPPLAAINATVVNSSYDWAKYYRDVLKLPTNPAIFTNVNGNSYAGHSHHIVIESGTAAQHPYALAAQQILRSYDIDPYFSKENLQWAPNYGHTDVYVQYVAKLLQITKQRGATRDGIIAALASIAKDFTRGADFSDLLAAL